MRVAIGGLGNLAGEILVFLKSQNIKIVGVDSICDRKAHVDLRSIARILKLPVKSYEEIVALKPDIFLSLSYLKIIGKELLDNSLCINLHAGKLPKYCGRNPITHSIQNGEKYHTTTLHIMVEKVDAGDIIAERTIPISFLDTAKTLYDKVYRESIQMFKDEFPNILSGKFKTKKQSGERHLYLKDLDKRVDISGDRLKTYNKIRSLDFPPYEPAYYMEGGKKINITTEDYVRRILSAKKK